MFGFPYEKIVNCNLIDNFQALYDCADELSINIDRNQLSTKCFSFAKSLLFNEVQGEKYFLPVLFCYNNFNSSAGVINKGLAVLYDSNLSIEENLKFAKVLMYNFQEF